ncbi:patatin-like phospholipase family protein [Pseudoalteromonas obscura]|uniref:Patatin-like phospholipase family protein n=1 Tax=Pseudoalteromonas obscura TaxID=3048491 RepID=A0ABT7EP25_9GAMM|nr:patatin-like phospholipase family protein [Pseudoalteromonas sp. P94(2023)]MDK2596794.1 patatin-like phospholipase family protein [Pseudoalteromonas sp. P94(2023)]
MRDKVYGVFNGGGAKGAAFSGAVQAIDSEYDWAGVAGTSAGAITAGLLAAGYRGNELKDVVGNLDMIKLMDIAKLEDVQQGVTRWIDCLNVDLGTQLLLKVDPLMLCSEEELAFKKKYHAIFNELSEHQQSAIDLPIEVNMKTYWFTKIIANQIAKTVQSQFDIDEEALTENIHMLLFFKGTGYFDSQGEPGKKEVRVALRELILGLLRKKDLPEFILEKLENEGNEDNLLSSFLSLYYHGGLFEGKAFIHEMETLLQNKLRTEENKDLNNPVTFGELPLELHVMAADISANRLVRFPEDLLDYGYQDNPEKEHFYMDFSVAEAIRASMSIPLVFQTVLLENPQTNELHQLVDGGMLSNFPVASFIDDDDDIPICGFKLGEESHLVARSQRILPFILAHVNTLTDAHDKFMEHYLRNKLVVNDISLTMQIDDPELVQQKRIKLAEQKAELDKEIAILDSVKNQLINKFNALPQGDSDAKLFNQHIDAIDQSINELQSMLDELLAEPVEDKQCGTLDFDLTEAQKARLHENGKRAGEQALFNLKVLIDARKAKEHRVNIG